MQWFHRLNVLLLATATTIHFVTLLCPGSALPKKKWIDQIAMESEVPAADPVLKPSPSSSGEEMMQVSVLSHSLPGAQYGGFKINPNCKCGISNSKDGNQHPWTAAIFYNYRETSEPDAKSSMILFCTGTLINDRWVLTASRCVQ
ncbi:Kallikrein-9, partial [Orchesella cincta]